MARTRRTRILKIALITALVASLAASGVLAWIVHTTDPPALALETAQKAVESARGADAERYAAGPYGSAKNLLQLAQISYRGAEVRLFGFLDYEEVATRCEQARLKADEALQAALDGRKKAREAAQQSIAAANEALGRAQAGLSRGSFSNSLRTSMVRSELQIAQARSQFAREDFAGADSRAAGAKSGLDIVNERIDSYLEEYTNGKQADQWARWVRETLRDSRSSGGTAIIVDKLRRTCTLYRGGQKVKTYKVDLGGSPYRQKLRAGDRATPEGRYYITNKRSSGQTKYYKALLINYPNEEDRQRFRTAQKKGWVSSRSNPGSLIEIHGDGGRNEDWTLGCVALANRDMDHLFAHVNIGTPVTIVGTITSSQG